MPCSPEWCILTQNKLRLFSTLSLLYGEMSSASVGTRVMLEFVLCDSLKSDSSKEPVLARDCNSLCGIGCGT